MTVTGVTDSVTAVTVVVTITSCCCHFGRSISGPSGRCSILPVSAPFPVSPTGCFARRFPVFRGVRDCFCGVCDGFRGEHDIWCHSRRGGCHESRMCCHQPRRDCGNGDGGGGKTGDCGKAMAGRQNWKPWRQTRIKCRNRSGGGYGERGKYSRQTRPVDRHGEHGECGKHGKYSRYREYSWHRKHRESMFSERKLGRNHGT
ncbi:hypothetical protein G1C98_1590 [Bifidobacterium sp. DSM 109960]|uniref:Uncharacterized protein n=1 Tax=Bifidobacterium erythrocebi TaxID=2675325 RepID=A0A7Y0EUU8_9BIFI|nr:hypothetical protein [Bifidobacterium sp. DSM 109960]